MKECPGQNFQKKIQEKKERIKGQEYTRNEIKSEGLCSRLHLRSPKLISLRDEKMKSVQNTCKHETYECNV